MNTKKLVLGVFAVAAVIGTAPQVFGAQKLLLSMDPERQKKYEEDLEATEQRLKTETAQMKEMGLKELRCTELVIFYERRAHFLPGIATNDYELAELKVDRIIGELILSADEIARQAEGCCKEEAKARVKELELKLAEASSHKERMLQRLDEARSMAASHLDAARQLREQLPLLLAARIEYLNNIHARWVNMRPVSKKEDMARVERVGWSDAIDIIELEEMRVRALKDVSILRECWVRWYNAANVRRTIGSIIYGPCFDCHYPDCHMDGYDSDLCLRLQTSCKLKVLDYDFLNLEKIKQMIFFASERYRGETAELLDRTEAGFRKRVSRRVSFAPDPPGYVHTKGLVRSVKARVKHL